MLKKFGAIRPEDKQIMRQPKAVTKAQIKYLNYRGEQSNLLEELVSLPEHNDMPWENPPEFKS
jgi:hypothetical protein